MKQTFITALKAELEHTFGRKIRSSRDCLQLVDAIFQRTGETINANTLRRFFGLVQSQYAASSATLLILCRYCGFDSPDEVEVNIRKQTATDIARQEVLHYLVSLFRDVPPPEGQDYDRVLDNLTRRTIEFLERNEALIDPFQREVARTRAGQFYYYEQAVQMDHLNGSYGKGLRYYLAAKATPDAILFAHAIQVFRYWLNQNLRQLDKHMSRLADTPPHPHLAPHIMGRLMAARLFHLHAHGESTDKLLAEMRRYQSILKITRENSPSAVPDFELIICEALTLTGHLTEAREYLQRGRNYYAASHHLLPNEPLAIWETLLSNIDGRRTRKKNKAASIPSLDPLCRKYHSLLLYRLGTPLRQPSAKKQLAALVEETGFQIFAQPGGNFILNKKEKL